MRRERSIAVVAPSRDASASSPPGTIAAVKPRRTPLAIALVVLIGGLVASVLATSLWRGALRRDAQTNFARSAQSIEDEVDGRLDALAVVGRSTRTGLPRDRLTQEAFESAARNALADHPGVAASVVYVEPASDPNELDALRQRVRGAGVPDFEVNNPTASGEHLVATYELPSRVVRVFNGLDLARVPGAKVALNAARAEGRAIVSDTLERFPEQALVAYPELASSGVIVAVPVYGETTPSTPSARISDLRAWVVVVVSAQNVLEQAVSSAGNDLAAQLEELADPDAPIDRAGDLVASTSLEGGRVRLLTGDDPDTIHREPIERLGQHWLLTVAQLDGLGGIAARELLWLLVGGAAVSVLLAALVWSLANTRASALNQVALATAEVRRTEARFEAVVHNMPDLVVVTDDTRTISYVSPSLTALLGWSIDEAAGAEFASVVHPDDRDRFVDLLARGTTDVTTAVRVQAADGRYRWFEGAITNLDDDAAVSGLVITAHDVTAQKAVEDRLAHQATHDPLTLLPNRVIVDDRLSHALQRSRRDGSRAAAMFLDIDEFKVVNDTWGHAAGDQLLREVADRVQRAARSADTVGRYGGDEFVVICENLASVAEALVVAERIRDEVGRPALVEGAEVVVGTSIGVALSSPDEGTQDLIGRADAAMYEAKAQGRGRIVVDAEPTTV